MPGPASLLPLLLASALHPSVQGRVQTEARARNVSDTAGATTQAAELQLQPALTLVLQPPTWEWRGGYAPRFTLRPLPTPSSGPLRRAAHGML